MKSHFNISDIRAIGERNDAKIYVDGGVRRHTDKQGVMGKNAIRPRYFNTDAICPCAGHIINGEPNLGGWTGRG